MKDIRVGTASWTDPTLIKCKCFYPVEVKTPEERLRFYASQFPVVEVDSSFYAMPSFNNAVLWANRTPDHFVFDVKLFRAFTMHPTPLKALPAKVRDDLETKAGKTGNVYYKDMPDDIKNELWKTFLEAIGPLKAAKDYTPAVEFRNATWLSDRSRASTVSMLTEMNVPMVVVDEPQGFKSSMPPVWEATSTDLSVVRFHGHNDEMWEKKGLKTSAERFNYLYSKEELQEFIPSIERLASKTKQVHVMMNNCYEDKAQRNAKQVMELLGLA
jgi:uncharacterized protein YecE (DUF72 family)